MENTFITIHNLAPDANIIFVSDSVVDILGYTPDQVQGRSCFDFFHPDEVPFARSVHSRGVLLDKAAVLHYARIRAADGSWVSCECCFTVVHDVLVASTSIYRRDEKSERRAKEAPQIRRIFSCSPRDPRYHMLEHLSPKFRMPRTEREPRAALILNRFTRNLTVMFATNAVSSILGLRPDQVQSKSFYRCIQDNCLPNAMRCLESAKANDSIAYLRFWFQDPRDEDEADDPPEGESYDDDDQVMRDDEDDDDDDDSPSTTSTSDSDDGGAALNSDILLNLQAAAQTPNEVANGGAAAPTTIKSESPTGAKTDENSPGNKPSNPINGGGLDQAQTTARSRSEQRHVPLPSIELEAVVSCTSDGLVVILRAARPPIPSAHPPPLPIDYDNGLFAAPWAQQPIQPHFPPEMLYSFRAPLLPHHMPLRDSVKDSGGPPGDQLMSSIRDVAVFAWALVGINGNLASYARGLPRGEAQPPNGLPIWDPNAPPQAYSGPENQAVARWIQYDSTHGAKYGASQLEGLAPQSLQDSRAPTLTATAAQHAAGGGGGGGGGWGSGAEYADYTYASAWSQPPARDEQHRHRSYLPVYPIGPAQVAATAAPAGPNYQVPAWSLPSTAPPPAYTSEYSSIDMHRRTSGEPEEGRKWQW